MVRARPRRGAGHGLSARESTEHPAVAVGDVVLRPALEAAVEVAQAALAATPPLTPPRQIRPFLGLRRLPDRGLGPVRRALEGDDRFRQLVAAATTEELVGRVSWLWLQRPEGWDEEVASLAAAESAEREAAGAARDAADAARRLGTVGEALRRSEAEATSLRTELSRTREQLAAERRARRDADSELGRLRRRVAVLEAAVPPPVTVQPPLAATPAPAAAQASPGRQPVRLPPAVFDDTVEAADHLARVAGVVVLVDGYNVTKQARPGWSLAEQRQWLLDAVAGLAARTGASVHLVFDGEQHRATAPAVGPRRAGVLVRYTADGHEADDELLALVEGAPLRRPVVVVSSDLRVRAGAATRGANVVSSEAFTELLRR